jgi:hypothetical protein
VPERAQRAKPHGSGVSDAAKVLECHEHAAVGHDFSSALLRAGRSDE